MAVSLQLGINQLFIDCDFKTTPVRGDQGECFDFWLELAEDFCRQTDGSVEIVSDSAINQLDMQQHFLLQYIMNVYVTVDLRW